MTDGYHLLDRNAQQDREVGHIQPEKFGYLGGIIEKFRAAFQSRIPLGYEDETGFHIGVMSPEENLQ
jgi:hypothetical protein